MRIPISIICRTNWVHPDGTCSVFIRYCCNATQKPLLSTGIKIMPQFWNVKQGVVYNHLPKAVADYQALNAEIFRLKRRAEDLVLQAVREHVQDKAAFVKK